MRAFAYESPTLLADALGLLTRSNGDGLVRPLAGGTDLLTLMKADIASPTRLVDLKRIDELDDDIEVNEEGITLGALTTLAQIEHNALLREWCPVLPEAAAEAATPQLRNMATLAGNLLQRPRCWYFRNHHLDCWLKGGDTCPARDGENHHHALIDVSPCVAVHPSDLASALVALDASVHLTGPNGTRTMTLTEFFAPPVADRRSENTLDAAEIITAIHIPLPHADMQSTYLKAMDRKVWAFALAGVAATMHLEGGRVEDVRIVLTGVAPIPWRAREAERGLIGAKPSEDQFRRAAEVALVGAQPLAHNGYKLPLASALIRRALAAVS